MQVPEELCTYWCSIFASIRKLNNLECNLIFNFLNESKCSFNENHKLSCCFLLPAAQIELITQSIFHHPFRSGWQLSDKDLYFVQQIVICKLSKKYQEIPNSCLQHIINLNIPIYANGRNIIKGYVMKRKIPYSYKRNKGLKVLFYYLVICSLY